MTSNDSSAASLLSAQSSSTSISLQSSYGGANVLDEEEIRKNLRQVCPLSEPSSSTIDVAVLRHDFRWSEKVSQGSAIFLNTLKDTAVFQIVDEYKKQVPQAESITLRAYTGSEPLSPHIKIATLNNSNPLVLYAFEEKNPSTTADLNQICAKLWPTFATNLTVEFVERYNVSSAQDIREAIVEKWLTDIDIFAMRIDQQVEQLKLVVQNEIGLRSFFIVHHRLWAVSASSQEASDAVDDDAIFEAALKQWQSLDQVKLAQLTHDAMLSIKVFPLPKMPTGGPAFLSKDLDDDIEADDEQEEIYSKRARAHDWSDLGGEKLATQVEIELGFLRKISDAITAYNSDIFKPQIKQIQQAFQEGQNQSMKIGIVGATGAGKSSLVNSLLDEKKFIPTSCWRACTAVVTEISANGDSSHPYCASVNFVDAVSWEQDLQVSLAEIDEAGGEGQGLEGGSTSHEAAVAWDKVHAVYPTLKRDQLSSMNISNLVKHPSIVGILGQKKVFKANTAAKLHVCLRKFIDSKERLGSKNASRVAAPAYWPLIKSVQLFSPSPLLRCGVTLVDLPGVQDSNKARADVAQRYLKECSHIWVVAPLTRAVDDKSAKDLLGQAFKRQMTLDGNYTAITFIGSKSDEIGPQHEVASAFGIENELAALETDRRRISSELNDLNTQRESAEFLQHMHETKVNNIENQIHLYQSLDDQCTETGTVLSPKEASPGKRKRKRGDGDTEAIQKPANIPDQDLNRKLLTKQDIHLKLLELESKQTQLDQDAKELEEDLERLEKQIKTREAEHQAIPRRKWRLCIGARNEATRSAIRSDFIAGLREHDQDIAQEAENFDPHLDGPRDYKALESQLPVFCVSSRGFQRMCGIVRDENRTEYFDDEDQTEIPALKKHAAKLGNAAREDILKRQLNIISITVNNLKLSFHGTGAMKSLTKEQILQESANVRKAARDVQLELVRIVANTINSIQAAIHENILLGLPQAAEKAKSQALPVTNSWARSAQDGGIRWKTYKAIVRRAGVFTNKVAHRDFNEQLIEPMVISVTHGWGRTFNKLMPGIIRSGVEASKGELTEFKRIIQKAAVSAGLASSLVGILSDQIANEKERVKDSFNFLRADIRSKQKDASRAFVPVVRENMRPAYEDATAVHGAGSFLQMKLIITRQVEAVKDTMFDAAKDDVEHLLRDITFKGEQELLRRLKTIVEGLENTGLNMLSRGEELNKNDQDFRHKISMMLREHEHDLDANMDESTAMMIDATEIKEES